MSLTDPTLLDPQTNAEFLEWLDHFVQAMDRDGIRVAAQLPAITSRSVAPVLVLASQSV